MIIKVKNGAGIKQFKREVIQHNKPCFAMFHMKGCGHCEELRPKWERIKRKVGGKMVLAEIDSNSTESIGKGFSQSIRGYPTLMVIKNGQNVKEYQGPREEGAILQFIRENFLKRGGFRRRTKKSRKRRTRRRRRKKTRRRKFKNKIID